MKRLDRLGNNVISVADATAHLWMDLDRGALLKSRIAPAIPSIAAAREILEGVPSAILIEAFLARPLEKLGDHAGALEERERALEILPTWEPWQSGVLLVAMSRTLLALERREEAIEVARAALAHAPGTPTALAALAKALGDDDEGASLLAYLRDSGFPHVPDAPPTERERAATPWRLDPSSVARTTDEDLVRLLVLRDVDRGFCFKRGNEVRTAMALLRRGELGFARNAVWFDEGDSGMWTPVDWLGLAAPNSIVWLEKACLRRELEETDEGKKAKKLSTAKVQNRYSGLSHIAYRNEFLRTASEDDARTLLFHGYRPAMVDALVHAPSSALVKRFVELRAEVQGHFPQGSPNQLGIGTTGPTLRGAPIEYPMGDELYTGDKDHFPPRLSVSIDERSKCAACKAVIGVGETMLTVGKMDNACNPEWKRWHLACAKSAKKANDDLRRAIARERRDLT